MNEERSDHDWRRGEKLGLEPQIVDRATYHRIMGLNSLAIRETIFHHPDHNPGNDYILEIHRRLFAGIHPWAGKFRIPTDPHVMVAGFLGADAIRILRELDLLRAQFKDFLSSSIVPGITYFAVAFWHTRFERIHPFIDGNGRTGRFLLESQLHALRGPAYRPSLIDPEKAPYMEGLNVASRSKILTPLANLIAKNDGSTVKIPEIQTPFRLAPFFEERELTLEVELENSRI